MTSGSANHAIYRVLMVLQPSDRELRVRPFRNHGATTRDVAAIPRTGAIQIAHRNPWKLRDDHAWAKRFKVIATSHCDLGADDDRAG
jgi:hypothetical protein